MVLIETVGQKTKIRDSETPKPKGTQENKILRLIHNASEISRLEQKFPRP